MRYCKATHNVLLRVQQHSGLMKACVRKGVCSSSITLGLAQTRRFRVAARPTAPKTWQRGEQASAALEHRPLHTSSLRKKDVDNADPSLPTINPQASLSEQLRTTMRLVTHSVVVCTSSHGRTPRAMTMSSFTSLTLLPTPLVTFNIAVPSRTFDAIESSGAFNIHVLAGDPAGAKVANRFTRGNDPGAFECLDGVTLGGDNISPVLDGEGVIQVLKCKVLSDAPQGGLIRVRDHVVVFGEVLDMIPGSKAEGFGLAYVDRKYRQIGSVIARQD